LPCRFAAEVIASGDYDVVHAHVPALLAFADVLRAPLVYTLHHSHQPALARYYRNLDGVRLVAISARQAALADPPPHHVVQHGLDPRMYPGCGPGGDVAFFLGRLSWCKAPELAIEAARRAGLRIVVAGSVHDDDAPKSWRAGELEPALRERHVHWVRSADLAAKRRAFGRSRALLVPLRWEEPFGLVMIEAALAGCPVVAYARGAAPEIVEDGFTGFLVHDVEEMADALGRAARLDRRRIQVRARLRFGAARMASEYLAVYRAAVEERATTGARGLRPAAGEEGWTTLVQ
jgi:glycosyltransferase involved in cell wall biosynthesis